jgi:uncharacterized protein (DUF3820 family)
MTNVPQPREKLNYTMPFGKYKGTPLDQLDDQYLLWVGCLNDLRPPLLGYVLKEMGRRLAERPAGQVPQ